MDLSNESEKTLGQAFTDMAAVIESAGELVRLAERFASAVLSTREKESTETASSPASSVARAEMREMLVSVGVASPVTKETAGASYHKQLSRQLADWLSDAFENERRVDGCGGSLKASRGNILALPDVFCLFNRARGTELVSPEDVLRACQLWKSLGITSVRVKRFETSGLLVVHAADTSDDEVCGTLARLLESGADTPGDESSPARWKRIDASGASEALRVPPYVAGEYLRMAEGHGILCRDEAPETTWFYPNRFAEFQYDRRVEVS
jgi:ESCRT-II complex subunit VPS36